MFNLGVPELILILVVGLVVFGPKKLPEVGRSVGKGLREFKKAMNDIKQTIDIESELKDVADIKKEVTDIKTDIKSGIKDMVMGPDITSNHQTQAPTEKNEVTDSQISETDGEESRLSWVNNSTQWSMPEWAANEENENKDLTDGIQIAELQGTEISSSDNVTTGQAKANEDQP